MQKPKLLKVFENVNSSFDIRYEKTSHFDNPWHYHPELELTLVTKSSGIRFVGDSVERFEAGDLVLLGANLPHYWRNDSAFYQSNSEQFAEAIILRFSIDILGKQLMNLPEMRLVTELFGRAAQGLWFGRDVSIQLKPTLLKLHESNGINQLIIFLEIFKTLSQTDNFKVLSTKTFVGTKQQNDSNRINQVLKYIHANLQETIDLQTVAGLANMNPTAFCRYIKSQTNKTFVELLNEIRIANACRLLLEDKIEIAQICYECGFGNVTHFNYTFKKITGQNPTEYRKAIIYCA
jgi:AraC-like DNA-binding protein